VIDMLKRHAIQALRHAGHAQGEIARLVGVRVRRIAAEPSVTYVDEPKERDRRGIGRPANAEPIRGFIVELLTQEPALLAVEILRRAKLAGVHGREDRALRTGPHPAPKDRPPAGGV